MGYTAGAGDITTSSSTGTVVQIAETTGEAVVNLTGVIPEDDTIPQNTEGAEYLTLAITPTDASNKLLIEWHGAMSSSTSGSMIVALFQDSTADALETVYAQTAATTQSDAVPMFLTHSMTAGTTSATTFKIRAGKDVDGSVAMGKNLFGGAMKYYLRVTEYTP